MKHETNFELDKYKNPVYLSKRESVAQVIHNGLFLKPGQLLSHPERGVNIEKYLMIPTENIDNLQILSDLKMTCGSDLVGASIDSLSFQTIKANGSEFGLLLIRLTIDDVTDVMQVNLEKSKTLVKYNYSLLNDDVPI